MTEATARTVLLVKAIEQQDTTAELVSSQLRHEASLHARTASPGGAVQNVPSEQWVVRRAQFLFDQLRRNHPEVAAASHAATWNGWITPLAATLAFVLGVATNALGPDRRISLLAFPLLGMLGWNLMVYVYLLISSFKQRSQSHPPINFVLALARPRASRGPGNLPRALHAFSLEWLQGSARLNLARAKQLLHLAAALLAAGAIAGMYWRGLVFEFLAGWESTFLNADQVHQILRIVLGPASLLTGIPLPGPEQLESIRWPNQGENAARWIHLYAVTAGLFICVPRVILALFSFSQARRLSWSFPIALDDPYFQRLQAAPLLTDRAWIIPCGLELQGKQLETLRSFFYELIGLQARLHFETPINYGDEDEFLQRVQIETGAVHIIVVFNSAATPEAEHHGQLLHGLKSLLRSPDQRLVLLLDESNYRQRLSGQAQSEQQIENRRKTWQRLARDHNLPLVIIDLNAPQPDNWYDQLRRALDSPQPRPA